MILIPSRLKLEESRGCICTMREVQYGSKRQKNMKTKTLLSRYKSKLIYLTRSKFSGFYKRHNTLLQGLLARGVSMCAGETEEQSKEEQNERVWRARALFLQVKDRQCVNMGKECEYRTSWTALPSPGQSIWSAVIRCLPRCSTSSLRMSQSKDRNMSMDSVVERGNRRCADNFR